MLELPRKALRELDSGLPFELGVARYGPSKAFPEINVRISEDIRRCVAFIGVEDDTPGGAGIRCVGTVFFAAYDKYRYLVTVKHVILSIADAPYRLRLNRKDGLSGNLDIEVGDVRWFNHPDPDIDLAVAPFQYDLNALGNDVRYLAGFEKLSPVAGFDCGDFTYTIGLFRLLFGKRRNLPVVHSGNIALLPSDEKIPVRDWENPDKTRHVEGYLVQSESIEGLSGAPSFARPHVEFADMPTVQGPKVAVLLPQRDLGFLGVWQGAWDARADEARVASVGREMRVPVGMGIVIPAYKLKEIFEMPELKQDRERLKREWENKSAASLDSVPISETANVGADDANPNHLKDFTRLVDVAARKRPQGDQT